MHYFIKTVGPLSQDYLTQALLTYMSYPSYIPNGQRTAGREPLWPGSRPDMGSSAWPQKPIFGAQTPVFPSTPGGQWPGSQPPPAATPRSVGTPMQAFTGNVVSVAPGIELQYMGNAGRTYQDLFFWQQAAGGRTQLLSVVSRGAFHHWQELPQGWDNARLSTVQPVSLGSFQPGQPPARSVRQLTTAEKLAHAIYLARDYVGEEAKALIEELTSPSAVANLIAFEAIYTISLFFGVGELVTGIAVILGAIFVGEVVLDIISSLVSFVKLATAATDEAGLRAAAKPFAHAITLGAAIVAALVLRKAATKFKPGNVPENVVRNGGGGKKKPRYLAEAEAAGTGKKSPGKPKNDQKYHPALNVDELPDFPGAKRVKPKNQRKRWVDKKGNIYEWDSQHGEIEIYPKGGSPHMGSYNPRTGESKGPVSGRKTNPE